MLQSLTLIAASFAGGALNSVAGGGSFLTFPSLVFTGVPPIEANATSTIALLPGSLASAAAYRRELAVYPRKLIAALLAISLLGGVIGAVLLLRTPQALFARLVPYLLLAATLLFSFGPWLARTFRKHRPAQPASPGRGTLALLGIGQLLIAVYGGYFGGGIGILMLAILGIAGSQPLHSMNALKAVLAAAMNGVAAITFIAAGVVYWQPALIMVVGAVIGGYGGARVARRVSPEKLRPVISAIGLAMTVYFFIR